MDAIDDFLTATHSAHLDSLFSNFSYPPSPPQGDSHLPPPPPDPNDDPTINFSTDHTSIHDPTDITFDNSPVSAPLPANFHVSNLSFGPNPSASPSSPPVQTVSAASHVHHQQLQQLQQHAPHSSSQTHHPHLSVGSFPFHPEETVRHYQAQRHLSQQSSPRQVHYHSQTQPHPQPLMQAPASRQFTLPQQDAQVLLQSPRRPSASPHHLNSQQHSQHSQLSLFQAPSRRNSESLHTVEGGRDRVRAMHPVVAESDQASMPLLQASSCVSAPDDNMLSQQGQEWGQHMQLQLQQPRMVSKQQRHRKEKENFSGLTRRRSEVGVQKAAQQNSQALRQRMSQKKHYSHSQQTGSIGVQRPIGKSKGVQMQRQRLATKLQRMQMQVHQQERERDEEAMNEFGLMPHVGQGRIETHEERIHSTFQGQSQQQSHLISDVTRAGYSMTPGLSNISVPTSTIATGTTVIGTPSATNSTHQSPPETPHSSNQGKSCAMSHAPETQSDVHSSVDKKSDGTLGVKHESIATSTQPRQWQASSAKSKGGGGSVGLGGGTRAFKPRDRHARLRKRLKCRTHEQLVDELVELVRCGAVEESALYKVMNGIDVKALIGQCQEIAEQIYVMIPEDGGRGRMDGETVKRCKKLMMGFKTKISNVGKTLVEGRYWTEVVEFCVGVAEVNKKLPGWGEGALDKVRTSIHAKLEQFVERCVKQTRKEKTGEGMCAELLERCRAVFMRVVDMRDGVGDDDEEEEDVATMSHSRLGM